MGLWEAIIQEYTHPGETVLDPMSGVGSTLLAALMGRNVIAVELETHFVAMLRANWEKMRVQPMLGFTMGNVQILQGDARNLAGLLVDSRPPDAIVTSPPFQDVAQSIDTDFLDKLEARRNGSQFQGGNRDAYGANAQNIGNLRQDAYWEAMRQCCGQYLAVLRPGGVMALVLKGFTRDGQYIDLPTQMLELCTTLGFQPVDRWRRELWSLSFWRVLQKRRDPAAFDERLKYEEVVVLRKPQGTGYGVHAVVTSPPYEGSVDAPRDGIDWGKQADGRKKQEPHGVGSYGFSYTRKPKA